ncbi:patatin-like phospholipase family protein [Bacillus spongiae]|uniref:Patatin-like phospholipase family protein n=1 Tax=Bacillus spongiae TaxID=2683610 RepID=A0ABU8HGJ0_9BACI
MLLDGVFEGGGVRGIAHVGAVESVELRGYRWNRLAGTSAGAVIAALLACEYSGSEIKDIIDSVDYTQFMKKNWLDSIPLIGKGINLLIHEGLYDNHYQETWLEDLLIQKGYRYFSDLKEGQLKIIVSDITNGRMTILPDDLHIYGETHDFPIAKAVRMSSTIPFFFYPIKWKTKKFKHPSYMVDGGLLSNFPIWIFDTPDEPKWPTFGFHFVRDKMKSSPMNRIGPIRMYRSMFKTMMQAHDFRYFDDDAYARTVKIHTGTITSTDFQLTEDEKQWLYQAGFQAAEKFLNTWSFKEYKRRFRSNKRE